MVRPDCRPRVDSRGVRELVARGIMAYSLVIQPLPAAFLERWNTVVHRSRADHLRLAQANQRGAFGAGNKVGHNFQRPQFGGGAMIRPNQLAAGIKQTA